VGYALLAKIYFQMNDFPNARIAVDSLLGPEPGVSLKYPLSGSRDLSRRVYGGKEDAPYGPSRGYEEEKDAEIICDFYGTSEESGPNLEQNAWGWIFTPDPLYGDIGRSKISEEMAAGYFALSQSFMDYVNFDRNDKRGEDFIDVISGPDFDENPVDYYWPLKYQVERINVLWYRSAEFFLMRAECNARAGNDADALLDLDYIRDRADLDGYAGSDDDQGDLVAAIIQERAREMFQDNYRYFELLRLGVLDEAKLPVGDRREEDIVVGGSDGVNWDDPSLLFPLPANE
jgi:hypothetical protein